MMGAAGLGILAHQVPTPKRNGRKTAGLNLDLLLVDFLQAIR